MNEAAAEDSRAFSAELLSVVELKNELKSRGLRTSGRKAELVQRLREDVCMDG